MTLVNQGHQADASPTHRRGLIVALVALAVLVSVGAWFILTSDTGVSSEEQAAQQQLAEGPAPGGVVQVTVTALQGVEGGGLAGVLVPGSELKFYDSVEDRDLPVGGFGVEVTSDPFATTQTVHQPGEEFAGAFPFVSSAEVVVEPGTYTLMLWAAPSPLGAYSRWVPASAHGLRGCNVTFTVEAGQDTALSVGDLPLWDGAGEAGQPCTAG